MIDAMLDLLTAHPALNRWIAGTLGFLAAFTHGFRLITYWHRFPSVLRVWGVIIAAFSAACSLGSYVALQRKAPPSELTLVVACIQLAVVVAAIVLPWLVTRSRRPLSPLVVANPNRTRRA